MGTIAKGAVLAVALWERGQGGDRGGISKIIPTGTGTDRSCGEIDGATSASIAGTVVTVNVPQPAGQVYHVMLDCLFA